MFLPLREFADYSAILTNGYQDDFRPWQQRRAADVTGYRAAKLNATPAIPPQVLDPLLAGAPFFVETASTDILNARTEHQRLWEPLPSRGGSARIGRESPAALTNTRRIPASEPPAAAAARPSRRAAR